MFEALSVRTITSENILWLLWNLHMLTCVTPAFSLSKIVKVAVILLLQGGSKEIPYFTVNERYLLEVNFSIS